LSYRDQCVRLYQLNKEGSTIDVRFGSIELGESVGRTGGERNHFW